MADFTKRSWRRGLLIGAAIAALGTAATAQAQDADRGHRGGWGERADGGRGDRQPQGERQPAQIQQQVQVRQQAQQAPDSGWRQRAPDAQRSERRSDGGSYGRQWGSGGRVERPAQAAEAGAPAVPQRGSQDGWRQQRDSQSGQWGGRNPSYRDPRRDGQAAQQSGSWGGRNPSYRDPQRDPRGSQTWGNSHDWRRDDAGRQWSRDWRQDRRYDYNSYRSAHRDTYRMAPYYAPYRNYSYRRLSIGSLLENLFFGQRYWINDPWQYRLPEVYGPYRWVRYYDDAVLVDIYSGEVVDTIYNFFW